jgi:hypothetical protein
MRKNGEFGLVPDQSRALNRAIASAAMRNSLAKLAPRVQLRNSVTLGVYAGSIFTTIVGVATSFGGMRRSALAVAIAACLWVSVLLANFVEALAEEWYRARAAMLRSMGGHVQAKQLLGANRRDYRLVEAGALRRGDVVLVEADDIIPADGTVIEGAASVSEAAVIWPTPIRWYNSSSAGRADAWLKASRSTRPRRRWPPASAPWRAGCRACWASRRLPSSRTCGSSARCTFSGPATPASTRSAPKSVMRKA